MTVLLWGFVVLTLFIWGRGTFCGWLCPFGALQEFIGKTGRRLGVRQISPTRAWDSRLKKLKYVVLAAILVSAVVLPGLRDGLAEIEPFKTAITLVFDRSWPYVMYAVSLLIVGAFVYKAFCRYLCPLGAALAALGSVQRLDWLTRRSECGSPCQLCRRICDYKAIAEDGRIIYSDCFQCLDCVSVYTDPKRCVAEVVMRRSGRRLSSSPTRARVP
jgi:polyferredoxin